MRRRVRSRIFDIRYNNDCIEVIIRSEGLLNILVIMMDYYKPALFDLFIHEKEPLPATLCLFS